MILQNYIIIICKYYYLFILNKYKNVGQKKSHFCQTLVSPNTQDGAYIVQLSPKSVKIIAYNNFVLFTQWYSDSLVFVNYVNESGELRNSECV